MRRAANLRVTLWTLGLTAIAAAIALGVAWWILPSPAEIASLRAERDELRSNLEQLDERGGRADLQHCGDERRLCVRVDLRAGR